MFVGDSLPSGGVAAEDNFGAVAEDGGNKEVLMLDDFFPGVVIFPFKLMFFPGRGIAVDEIFPGVDGGEGFEFTEA